MTDPSTLRKLADEVTSSIPLDRASLEKSFTLGELAQMVVQLNADLSTLAQAYLDLENRNADEDVPESRIK